MMAHTQDGDVSSVAAKRHIPSQKAFAMAVSDTCQITSTNLSRGRYFIKVIIPA